MSGIIVRTLGRDVEYSGCVDRMRAFTAERDLGNADEIWVLEHAPVFTRGMRDKSSPDFSRHPEHRNIPVISTDRGGLTTYHGPGQVIIYTLLDLRRLQFGIRHLVHRLEQSVIDLVSGYGISASRWPGAPGVYVGEAKLAALGLRVRRGCCYHGLSINVSTDLTPFKCIDPCGMTGLEVTSTTQLGMADGTQQIAAQVIDRLTDCH